MKNQTQKTATASPQARRNTQRPRQLAAPLLTVTLDAQASACVRRFAEEFGEDVRDVASGSILDTLPQALEEWDDTKQQREKFEPERLTYWQGTAESVRDARKRRGAKQAPAKGASLPPGGPLTLGVTLAGFSQAAFLAMCQGDGLTAPAWLTESVQDSLRCWIEARRADWQKPEAIPGTVESFQAIG